MAVMTIKDHWAFLEEIEAPMWVDLNLEAKSSSRDPDDAWFRTSHMFHQCSSRLLKDAFLNSGESSMPSDLEPKESSSPKLSSSVSRSRGKEYTSKKWKVQVDDFLLNKEHQVMGLNGALSSLNSGSSVELKSKLIFVNSKRTSRLKINATAERVSDGNTREKGIVTIPRQRDLDVNTNSSVDKGTESITSTITFESNQQPQQTNPEITSKAFGRSSGLLSALKVGLRKSCATRQASRVEIGFNERESRDRKSSSGKSSVGSSSNPGCDDVKKSARASMLSKDKTPYSRNVFRMTEAAMNKIKESNMPKASHGPVKNNIGKASRVAISNLLKSACQDAVKSKVQPHAKALNSHRVNERASVGATTVREKVKVDGPRKLVIAGKENKAGTTVSQKCRSGNISNKAVSRSQKGAKIDLSQKGDSTGVVVPKGKVSSPSSGKHLRTVTQRIHLR